MRSPCYRRGALFVIYDEWSGFFDHVRPPSVPDDRASTDLNENFGQMGFRVPAVAVSPYARRAKKRWGRFNVDHGLYGHESILKFISYRFGLGDLTKRVQFANNIGRSFEWHRPDFELPSLPDPPQIVTQPCALGDGYRLPVHEGKTGDIFTLPDSITKGLEASPR